MAELKGSFLAKSAWAQMHVKAYEAQVKAWVNVDAGPPFEFANEYEAKRHRVVVKVGPVPALPRVWGFCIGDAVFNFRSALDHLAWFLVQTHGVMPSDERQRKQIQFPIYDSSEQFWGSVDMRLPGVPTSIRDVIYRHQPAAKTPTGEHLAWLAWLNNLDKHRAIVPVVAQTVANIEMTLIRGRNFIVTRVDPPADVSVFFKPGAVLGYAYGRPTGRGGKPDVEVRMRSRQGFYFENGGLVDLTLWGIAQAVENVIRDVGAAIEADQAATPATLAFQVPE